MSYLRDDVNEYGTAARQGERTMSGYIDELFWGAYLSAAYEAGEVTETTDVAEMKRQFMAGIQGDAE